MFPVFPMFPMLPILYMLISVVLNSFKQYNNLNKFICELFQQFVLSSRMNELENSLHWETRGTFCALVEHVLI